MEGLCFLLGTCTVVSGHVSQPSQSQRKLPLLVAHLLGRLGLLGILLYKPTLLIAEPTIFRSSHSSYHASCTATTPRQASVSVWKCYQVSMLSCQVDRNERGRRPPEKSPHAHGILEGMVCFYKINRIS